MMEEKLKQLVDLNPEITLHHVNDKPFLNYGKVLSGYQFDEVIAIMKQTEIPEEGNVYFTSITELEKTEVRGKIQSQLYGGMEIQIGYCNGRNSSLNGLEYHKGSEVNVAATDLVLLLGKVQDIKDNKYSSERVEGFFIPEGTAVEMYQTTLHFAPCKVTKDGFKCIVILPKGTNEPLQKRTDKIMNEDDLLFMTNKWLLAHPERKILVDKGAYPGIQGKNLLIKF